MPVVMSATYPNCLQSLIAERAPKSTSTGRSYNSNISNLVPTLLSMTYTISEIEVSRIVMYIYRVRTESCSKRVRIIYSTRDRLDCFEGEALVSPHHYFHLTTLRNYLRSADINP